MRYLLTFVVILAISFIDLHSAEKDIELSPSVLKAIESYEKDVLKAKQKLNKAMLKEEDRATKNGKFDLVMGIRAKRKELIGEVDLFGNKKTKKEIPCSMSVKYTGKASVVPLTDNTIYLLNRSFTLGTIPEKFKNLKITRLQGHDVHPVTITAESDGECFVLIDARFSDSIIESISKEGWTSAGSITANDPMGSFKVYSKKMKKREVAKIPATAGGWISVAVAAPDLKIK